MRNPVFPLFKRSVAIIREMKTWAASVFAVVAFASQSGKQPETPKIAIIYREVMIPMRDGVRLQTVIILPKDAKEPLRFCSAVRPMECQTKKAQRRLSLLIRRRANGSGWHKTCVDDSNQKANS